MLNEDALSDHADHLLATPPQEHCPDGSSGPLAPRASGTRIKVPFRGRGFQPVTYPIFGWLTFGLLGLSWYGSTLAGWVSPTFLPSPLTVLKALEKLALSGQLWTDVSASLSRIAAGWVIGTIIGLATGIAMGLFSVARSIGSPTISLLYPVPKIALLPLLILWLGIGETSKVATIAAGVFFPTAIATFTAIDGVPRNIIRMSQAFGVPLRSIILKTLLPGALPGIFAGMRISIATGLLTVVAAEMIGAQNGVGAFVLLQGSLMRSDQLLAGVMVIALMGLCMSVVISLLERILLRWR